MNRSEERYTRFALVREMLETPGVVRKLDAGRIGALDVRSERVFLSGEGSSRIFPAKHLMSSALRHDWPFALAIQGGDESCEYDLGGRSVFIASNSGRTAEAVRLLRKLLSEGHNDITGITRAADSPIASECTRSYVLTCGNEDAVAATKSVVEQALFYDLLFRARAGASQPDLAVLGGAIEAALTAAVPPEVTRRLAESSVIYFAGRNDGVAEELALKTNEITRKKSAYLEGSFAVHGIEEVMESTETVLVVDPFPEEEEKFDDVLVKGVGLTVLAIAARETRFPTIRIPDLSGMRDGADFLPYVQLAVGWNLLVETGISLGIDLDRPRRARKVGNELVE
jgi:glucosamine--fructose-6-phosphate aminotransferase (isomerizing)